MNEFQNQIKELERQAKYYAEEIAKNQELLNATLDKMTSMKVDALKANMNWR